MKICPNCGFSNKDESEYCEACGANLDTKATDIIIDKDSNYKTNNKQTSPTQVIYKQNSNSSFTPLYGKTLKFACPKCGREISEKNKICPGCGAKIKSDSFLDEEVTRYTKHGHHYHKYTMTRRESLIYGVIGIIIFIIFEIIYNLIKY